MEEPDLGIDYREPVEPDELPVEPPIISNSGSSAQYDDLSFLASLPVKLPPIASEDLEHFDDKVLDAQYVRKLEILDELDGPVPQAAAIVRRAIGQATVPSRSVAASNGAAAAPARTPLNLQIPDFTEDDTAPELPYPGESASPDELLAYANSKRAVKLLKRVFRAKLTGITPKTELS